MRRNYSVRPSFDGLDSDDFDNEVDASSTIGATSSPPGPQIPDLGIGAHIPFLDLDSALLPDDNDDEDTDDPTYGSNSRAPKLSNEQKTLAVLEFMKDKFPRLSLRLLLTEIFTSDNPAITNVTNTYLSMGGRIHLLETAMGGKFLLDSEITDWIMGKATAICTREVQGLTDMASKGDHFEDAKYLRLSANSITVDRLRSFSVPGLLKLYERTTPRLQEFLTAVIGKDSPPSTDLAVARSQRNPDMVSSF